jgi:two-component system chemotaxis response regulator CheY
MSEALRKFHPILVVEDIAEMRELILRLLRVLGYGPVYEAKNGLDAAAQIENNTFDLILCDWNMPGKTGLELLHQLRADPDKGITPFIMITGENQRERIAAAIEAGVTDYLLKPFTLAGLEHKLKTVFAEHD